MTRTIYTLLIILFAQSISAQRIIPQHMLDSIANPKMLQLNEEVLKFASKEKNIGTLSEDDAPSTYRFIFRNVSKKTVSLRQIKTSCGCTVAKYDKQPVAPGKEGEITLTYNPSEQPGQVYSRAFVYTNLSDAYPTVCLTLTGKVTPSMDQWKDYPHAMGKLRLRYTTVYFSEVPPNLSPSERIECANSGKSPLKLSVMSGMLPSYVAFRTEPEVIQPGESAEIVITIKGNLLPRNKELLRFPLILDGLNVPLSQRTLNVKVDTNGY